MAKAEGKLILKFTPEQVEQAMGEVKKEGYTEGFKAGAQKVLDYLESRYMDEDKRPDRGTPEAKAILLLTKDLSNFMRKSMQVVDTVNEESKK